MGIAFCLIRVTPESVSSLRGRPRAATEFICGDDDVYKAPSRSIFSRLFGKKEEVTGPAPERRDGDEIDLDKSWHIVHYLLTGEIERAKGPLGLIANDLDSLVDVEIGVGRPSVISTEAVRAFADAAEVLTDDQFFQRFVPAAMPTKDLYLGEVIARGDYEQIREYALENFQLLRTFAHQAADDGDAIITYYS